MTPHSWNRIKYHRISSFLSSDQRSEKEQGRRYKGRNVLKGLCRKLVQQLPHQTISVYGFYVSTSERTPFPVNCQHFLFHEWALDQQFWIIIYNQGELMWPCHLASITWSRLIIFFTRWYKKYWLHIFYRCISKGKQKLLVSW